MIYRYLRFGMRPKKGSFMEQIRNLLAQLKMYCRLEMAMVDKIDEQSQQIYALQEDCKRYKACIASLETRYSELLYTISSLKKQL